MSRRAFVAFSGSRGWTKEAPVREALEALSPERCQIVHGGCARGLDAIVDRLGRAMGFSVAVERVSRQEWRELGRGAGPRRNARMLRTYKPCALYVFVKLEPNGEWSPGTRDCYERARARGIPATKTVDKSDVFYCP
jgi:hypothetical protein